MGNKVSDGHEHIPLRLSDYNGGQSSHLWVVVGYVFIANSNEINSLFLPSKSILRNWVLEIRNAAHFERQMLFAVNLAKVKMQYTC